MDKNIFFFCLVFNFKTKSECKRVNSFQLSSFISKALINVVVVVVFDLFYYYYYYYYLFFFYCYYYFIIIFFHLKKSTVFWKTLVSKYIK